ncbi:MAG: hypothetical protein ACSHXB_12510 [Sulfitobacter sp.]
MKNRMILYVGLALIVGLYVYDRNSKTEVVLPATVLGVESRVAEKGGDTWHITATIDSGEVLLEPRASRPDMAIGDRICVTAVLREGQPSEYLLASGARC